MINTYKKEWIHESLSIFIKIKYLRRKHIHSVLKNSRHCLIKQKLEKHQKFYVNLVNREKTKKNASTVNINFGMKFNSVVEPETIIFKQNIRWL